MISIPDEDANEQEEFDESLVDDVFVEEPVEAVEDPVEDPVEEPVEAVEEAVEEASG